MRVRIFKVRTDEIGNPIEREPISDFAWSRDEDNPRFEVWIEGDQRPGETDIGTAMVVNMTPDGAIQKQGETT